MPAVIYIHGFLSSPGSLKAQQTKQWLQLHRPDIRYHCPYLSPYPEETEAQLRQLLLEIGDEEVGLIGSSLGGFWATWLVEHFDLRAVLINPSVAPHALVDRVDGEPQYNYHTQESYLLTQQHKEQFLQVYPERLKSPQNYWLMAQTGDETLDYRESVERYRDCRQLIEEGGDHAFQGYEEKIADIVHFLFRQESGSFTS